MTAQNVLIAKIIPVYPDQLMYPGSPATILSYQYILSGAEEIEGLTCQIWWKDETAGFFRQTASVKIVNSSFSLLAFQLGMLKGTICLHYDIATNGVTNVFTYTKDSVIVEGGSVNLGIAPNPPNYTSGGASQLPPMPFTPPVTVTKKRRR